MKSLSTMRIADFLSVFVGAFSSDLLYRLAARPKLIAAEHVAVRLCRSCLDASHLWCSNVLLALEHH
jgi:hypothetical protein